MINNKKLFVACLSILLLVSCSYNGSGISSSSSVKSTKSSSVKSSSNSTKSLSSSSESSSISNFSFIHASNNFTKIFNISQIEALLSSIDFNDYLNFKGEIYSNSLTVNFYSSYSQGQLKGSGNMEGYEFFYANNLLTAKYGNEVESEFFNEHDYRSNFFFPEVAFVEGAMFEELSYIGGVLNNGLNLIYGNGYYEDSYVIIHCVFDGSKLLFLQLDTSFDYDSISFQYTFGDYSNSIRTAPMQ